MPQPFHGEYNAIEEGAYPAIITQVVCLGHQTYNGVARTKFHIEFDIPSIQKTYALNNFGIYSWLTPAKPAAPGKTPFIGFYELIKAVSAVPLTKEYLEAYDFFDLAGHPVMLTFENVGGYMNIVSVDKLDEGITMPVTMKPIITVGKEEFGNSELVGKLSQKVQGMIATSQEWLDLYKDKDPFSTDENDIIDVQKEEVDIPPYDAKEELVKIEF